MDTINKINNTRDNEWIQKFIFFIFKWNEYNNNSLIILY